MGETGRQTWEVMENWQVRFLTALREVGTVKAACEAAMIGRDYAYRMKNADPDFAAAWKQAFEDRLDRLEEVAFKRAEAQSDRLIVFMLASHRPKIYGKKFTVSGDPENPIRHQHDHVVIDLEKLSTDALREIYAQLPEENQQEEANVIEGEFAEIEEDSDDE